MRVFMVAIALIGLVSAVALGNVVPPTAENDGETVVPNLTGKVDEVETVLEQPPLIDDDQQATVHNEVDEKKENEEAEEEENAESTAAVAEEQSDYLQNKVFDDRYFKGYRIIEDVLKRVVDQAVVAPGVTAWDLRYDHRYDNNRAQCTVAFFKQRVAKCEGITNFSANVFCRRATVNMASYCGKQERTVEEYFATFLKQLGEKAKESRELFAHEYNWNNYKLPLEIYIDQIEA